MLKSVLLKQHIHLPSTQPQILCAILPHAKKYPPGMDSLL